MLTWVLVADGKTARVYQCQKTARLLPTKGLRRHSLHEEKMEQTLMPVQGAVIEAESIDDYQLGHDRRGTILNSADTAHNAYEPHGNIRKELRRRFLKAIAEKLERAYAEKEFSRLILVAPAKMLGELHEQLSVVQSHIVAVLPKDLAHFEGQELLPYLQDTLMEAHVA
jgi:protein required for attachment to host cells